MVDVVGEHVESHRRRSSGDRERVVDGVGRRGLAGAGVVDGVDPQVVEEPALVVRRRVRAEEEAQPHRLVGVGRKREGEGRVAAARPGEGRLPIVELGDVAGRRAGRAAHDGGIVTDGAQACPVVEAAGFGGHLHDSAVPAGLDRVARREGERRRRPQADGGRLERRAGVVGVVAARGRRIDPAVVAGVAVAHRPGAGGEEGRVELGRREVAGVVAEAPRGERTGGHLVAAHHVGVAVAEAVAGAHDVEVALARQHAIVVQAGADDPGGDLVDRRRQEGRVRRAIDVVGEGGAAARGAGVPAHIEAAGAAGGARHPVGAGEDRRQRAVPGSGGLHADREVADARRAGGIGGGDAITVGDAARDLVVVEEGRRRSRDDAHRDLFLLARRAAALAAEDFVGEGAGHGVPGHRDLVGDAGVEGRIGRRIQIHVGADLGDDLQAARRLAEAARVGAHPLHRVEVGDAGRHFRVLEVVAVSTHLGDRGEAEAAAQGVAQDPIAPRRGRGVPAQLDRRRGAQRRQRGRRERRRAPAVLVRRIGGAAAGDGVQVEGGEDLRRVRRAVGEVAVVVVDEAVGGEPVGGTAAVGGALGRRAGHRVARHREVPRQSTRAGPSSASRSARRDPGRSHRRCRRTPGRRAGVPGPSWPATRSAIRSGSRDRAVRRSRWSPVRRSCKSSTCRRQLWGRPRSCGSSAPACRSAAVARAAGWGPTASR